MALTGLGLQLTNPQGNTLYPFLEGFTPDSPFLWASRYLRVKEKHIDGNETGHRPSRLGSYAGWQPSSSAGGVDSSFADNAAVTETVYLNNFFGSSEYKWAQLKDHPVLGQFFGSGYTYQDVMSNPVAVQLIRLLVLNQFAQDTITQLFVSDTENSLAADLTGRKNLVNGTGNGGRTRETYYSQFDGLFAKIIAAEGAGRIPAAQNVTIAQNETGTYSATVTPAQAVAIIDQVYTNAPSQTKGNRNAIFYVTGAIYDALIKAQWDKVFNAGYTTQLIQGFGADFSTATFELPEMMYLGHKVVPMRFVDEALQADFTIGGVTDRPHRVVFGDMLPFYTNYNGTGLTGTGQGVFTSELMPTYYMSVVQHTGMRAALQPFWYELLSCAGIKGGAFPIIP